MRFEWDPHKASLNLKKHDISFEEATTAFHDPLSATDHDPDHSIDEARWILFGFSTKGRLLVVSYTEHGETIRIISARLATKKEKEIYEEE